MFLFWCLKLGEWRKNTLKTQDISTRFEKHKFCDGK